MRFPVEVSMAFHGVLGRVRSLSPGGQGPCHYHHTLLTVWHNDKNMRQLIAEGGYPDVKSCAASGHGLSRSPLPAYRHHRLGALCTADHAGLI
jgi:hypothetical protein